MTQLDYYKVLRLAPSATPKEISNAYRDLSILYRDRHESLAKEIMKIIDEAHLVLQDPRSRANYDLEKVIVSVAKEQPAHLSEAEKIIISWGRRFTESEKKYINKIHEINDAIRILTFIIAIVFVWSVITFRWDVSFLMITGLIFLRNIIWSIYRIKNPPPLLTYGASNNIDSSTLS
jgi:hypothetical protein